MTLNNMLSVIQGKVLEMLKEKLPSHLYYHNYEHTMDVLEAAERIAVAENVAYGDMQLVKTAAAFHDAGFIFSRENHEQKSCSIAKELLSSNGINNGDIEKICDLILATKFPHHPKDKLGEIICDADLDYLGRDDYFSISKKLYKEFLDAGIVKNENDWNRLQVKFLETHHYFTKTSINTRKSKKDEHLRKIKESL
jgi:uncharacterized protein